MNTLPDSLDRYERELEAAVRRDLRRRSRRRGARLAVLAAAVVGAALAAVALVPGDGASAVQRAAAALRPAAGTILHSRMVARQENGDGTVATWTDERWQLMAPPYDSRQIETSADGRAETAVVDGRVQLYDAKTDTVYVGDAEPEPAAAPTETERAKGSGGRGGKSPSPKAQREPAPAAPQEEPFRAKIRALLEAGKAREAGRTTVGGREAIRLALADGSTYLVDASSYDPIELVSRGSGGSVTLRFPVYERLPATAANRALLSVTAQHPDATVDDDQAAYVAASARLFPHG